MKPLQRLFFALFSLLLSFFAMFSVLEVQASSTFSGLESNISKESSALKIKKLQNFFTELWLYAGPIDGSYNSIKWTLLAYQKKAGIIKYDSDYGAGYFWKKTLKALEKDFPTKFHQKKEIIKHEEINSQETYFYVTAYYSPLPGQRRYTTGSYWWDVRLNWNGKHTASWKKVYTWIVAAPRNYPFGTKIELDWIWVTAVEDRWWAIVNSWERGFEYDRIDVWMWHGDEWLARALKWWKRKVKWRVVESFHHVNVKFDESPVSKYVGLKVKPESKTVDVKRLQQLLSDVDIYNGKVDGNYHSVKNELINYQVNENIIPNKHHDSAWYFWKKTFASMQKKYGWKWDFFIPPTPVQKIIPASLTRKQKLKLDKSADTVNKYVRKKSKNNRSKIRAYNKWIHKNIDKLIWKTKSQLRKKQLNYLKSKIK